MGGQQKRRHQSQEIRTAGPDEPSGSFGRDRTSCVTEVRSINGGSVHATALIGAALRSPLSSGGSLSEPPPKGAWVSTPPSRDERWSAPSRGDGGHVAETAPSRSVPSSRPPLPDQRPPGQTRTTSTPRRWSGGTGQSRRAK